MKLTENCNLPAFLRAADCCAGEVTFQTPEGDVLNLKSQLSKYVFLAAAASPEMRLLAEGEVFCGNPADEALLAEFVRRITE